MSWSRTERFHALLAGERADRPAISAYAHQVGAERNADDLVAATLAYARAGDWDWVKLNPRTVHYAEAWGNTYDYDHYGPVIPIPAQTHAVLASPADLGSITDLEVDDVPAFTEQLEVIRRVKAGTDAAVVATVYSPYNVLVKLAGLPLAPGLLPPGSATEWTLKSFLDEDRDGVHAALGAIARTLGRYTAAQKEAGADGVMIVTAGQARDLGRDGNEELGRPYDSIVLNGATGIPRLVHTCGPDAHPHWFEEYPLEGINWDTYDPTNPGNDAEISKVFVGGAQAALLGGLREDLDEAAAADEIRRQVNSARRLHGDRLVVAPSCSIVETAPVPLLAAYRLAVEEPLG